MRSHLVTSLFVGCAALSLARGVSADSLAVVPPRPVPGPYAVQCSDVAQDFSRIAPGLNAQNYWEATQGYVTDLLLEPGSTPTVTLSVPNNAALFGSFAGRSVVETLIVCAPTASSNPRASFELPTGRAVPHMLRAGDAPIWPDATTRFPILLFSHGLRGSPLSNDYITALGVFASWGYVVVAPFHGDPRFADISIDDVNDILPIIAHFSDYIAMQAVRPLALSAALDLVLSDPNWAPRVDPARVGAFGASLGGESVMLLGGARLTNSIGLSSQQVIFDQRINAAVGYVPYFGQSFFPSFGRDQAGVDDVTIPFLAISGTNDNTAPLGPTQQAMSRLTGTRELVALQGVGHYFDIASTGDIFTWSLTFLDAHAAGDRGWRAVMQRMVQVAGGGDDRLLIDYNAPAPPLEDEVTVVEFYNAQLNHYFLTADAAEAAMLDAGVLVPGWHRTGFDFKAWMRNSAHGLPACRFFGTPGVGPNSHFYTTNQAECALRMNDPYWRFEAIAFNAELPVAEDCPLGRSEVWRLYNNGMGGQANHRFLTSHSEIAHMVDDEGWYLEGAVFCAPP
jgi:predicted dienelactone hydrolase